MADVAWSMTVAAEVNLWVTDNSGSTGQMGMALHSMAPILLQRSSIMCTLVRRYAMLGILDKPILYFDTRDIELATMNIKPDTGPGLW